MVLEISFIFVGTSWCDCSVYATVVESRDCAFSSPSLNLVRYLCCFPCEKYNSFCICIIACTVSLNFAIVFIMNL
jgi:hypothetical protein